MRNWIAAFRKILSSSDARTGVRERYLKQRAQHRALAGRVGATPRTTNRRTTKSVNLQTVVNVVTAVLVARVFGSDAIALLRRAAAMGVRVGVSELRRGDRAGGER
ncbi:hypothetical protein GCM10009680_84200 [Streptomyces yatensis]|uniref:Uncharacterized protein n=1 Tax=Streptomyces yatensis TaxID=155177 RepID=A0ABP4VLI3_9ACTN